MDNKELDAHLRNLVIFVIAVSEKITSRSAFWEIDKARDEIEDQLRRVAEWIKEKAG
jgi:ribosome-associated translation inhibitor RaiA